MDVPLDGTQTQIPITSRLWPTNIFMGVRMRPNTTYAASARREGNQIVILERATYQAAQGPHPVESHQTLELSENQERLILTIHRESRRHPIQFVFKRKGTREAYFYPLKPRPWRFDGGLSENTLLITLQGLANTETPRLYYEYPDKWAFSYTPQVKTFLEHQRDYTFHTLHSVKQVVNQFRQDIRGYVIYDPAIRASAIVGLTLAGLERVVLIGPEHIGLMQELGIPQREDLRGKFKGQSDVQIYGWAYQQYGARCSRDYIVWMGGECHGEMLPAVADFGVARKAFFVDLNTRADSGPEYALASQILSKQHTLSHVLGWHSYCKDLERTFISLASHHTLRVDGLNTLPNLSFMNQVPVTPGFKFTNSHNTYPGEVIHSKEKVYISCVQTDGLGLGAWIKPGRGELPYAWECSMNFLKLQPALLEWFYRGATKNDFFIGSLGGPGYMYPKQIPAHMLPRTLQLAQEEMDALDLNVFDVMDYSEGSAVVGNTDLPRRVVEAYFDNMNHSIGFVNGYAPSYTYATRNGIPWLSFDYYLAPHRSQDDAVDDLLELATLNPTRPYFLTMHVREYSDVQRVKAILARLPQEEFEVVPLDRFVKMAGRQPTFKTRFEGDP
eukprot:gnl/Trimastix_PCT/4901.p1 GENE.gnl/Trimastix_PCT/4901~~gnl/Trimastix_PCT/4901.p1  ORF type:complete len:694 (-),score=120.31 gnl/Trimastix_PCT/4901:80-1921(-)